MTSQLLTRIFVLLLTLASSLAASACGTQSPTAPVPRPGLPPVTAVGEWRATAVRDIPLPAAAYVFDEEVDGQRMSIHLIVEEATLTLDANGRYVHHIRYSEWDGPPGGPPRTRRFQFAHNDFGEWSRSDVALRTLSGWLQNHAMSGELATSGDVLRLQHGLSHGDPPVSFRYVRQSAEGPAATGAYAPSSSRPATQRSPSPRPAV